MSRNVQASKKFQLAKFLGESKTDIMEQDYQDNVFECGRNEYLVLTDKEADDLCAEKILDSVWAFSADFLACHLKKGVDRDVVKCIQNNGKCEDNNKAILSLIDDEDHFVQDAMKCDGRAHFLSTYDGEENEVRGKTFEYFIYRLN